MCVSFFNLSLIFLSFIFLFLSCFDFSFLLLETLKGEPKRLSSRIISCMSKSTLPAFLGDFYFISGTLFSTHTCIMCCVSKPSGRMKSMSVGVKAQLSSTQSDTGFVCNFCQDDDKTRNCAQGKSAKDFKTDLDHE